MVFILLRRNSFFFDFFSFHNPIRAQPQQHRNSLAICERTPHTHSIKVAIKANFILAILVGKDKLMTPLDRTKVSRFGSMYEFGTEKSLAKIRKSLRICKAKNCAKFTKFNINRGDWGDCSQRNFHSVYAIFPHREMKFLNLFQTIRKSEHKDHIIIASDLQSVSMS